MAHLDSNDETFGLMALLGYPTPVVTGPGRYLTRGGEAVTVEEVVGYGVLAAHGKYSCGIPERWSRSGRVLAHYLSPNDIVAAAP